VRKNDLAARIDLQRHREDVAEAVDGGEVWREEQQVHPVRSSALRVDAGDFSAKDYLRQSVFVRPAVRYWGQAKQALARGHERTVPDDRAKPDG